MGGINEFPLHTHHLPLQLLTQHNYLDQFLELRLFVDVNLPAQSFRLPIQNVVGKRQLHEPIDENALEQTGPDAAGDYREGLKSPDEVEGRRVLRCVHWENVIVVELFRINRVQGLWHSDSSAYDGHEGSDDRLPVVDLFAHFRELLSFRAKAIVQLVELCNVFGQFFALLNGFDNSIRDQETANG